MYIHCYIYIRCYIYSNEFIANKNTYLKEKKREAVPFIWASRSWKSLTQVFSTDCLTSGLSFNFPDIPLCRGAETYPATPFQMCTTDSLWETSWVVHPKLLTDNKWLTSRSQLNDLPPEDNCHSNSHHPSQPWESVLTAADLSPLPWSSLLPGSVHHGKAFLCPDTQSPSGFCWSSGIKICHHLVSSVCINKSFSASL